MTNSMFVRLVAVMFIGAGVCTSNVARSQEDILLPGSTVQNAIELLQTYVGIQERDDPRKVRERVVDKLLTLDRTLEPLLTPLLALFGNAMAVVVSSRVLDPRAAQNLAATTVLPLLGLLVVQLAGRIALGPRFYVVLALGVAAADVALVFIAVRLFDRERLLTQWR